MLRRSPHFSRQQALRKGSTTAIALGATLGFAALLGALYFMSGTSDIATSAAPAKQVAAVEPQKAPVTQPKAVVQQDEQDIVLPDPVTQPKPQVTNPQPAVAGTLAQLVIAHLGAGEFGPALEVAQNAPTVEEQTELLKLVANAQQESGDFEGAMATIRRIPNPEERAKARGEHAAEESLAGGGSLADFTQLIELIQSETSGPWLEVDGDGGTISEYNTGVRVDPTGVLARLSQEEIGNQLRTLSQQARVADINEDMAKSSHLRMVSLTRLEKELRERMANGQPATASMQHLAGITRIQYVFVYPETGEIVIAGPAEGWKVNEQGQTIGINSGRPVMQLDDLVTVLRTFSNDGLGIFTCSIKPREEGLRKLKSFVDQSNQRGPLTPAGTKQWAERMERELGPQDIVYEGIPETSRVARVIIEADYRMKLIGIDKLEAPKSIPSYFDLLDADLSNAPTQLDALRWWLTMKYDAVMHSADRNAFEFRGPSVQCKSENELINELGQRIQTGQTDEVNRMFALNFTNNYQELAARDLVFADLQNIFDLALVASLIQHERLGERTKWDMGVFAPHGSYRITEHAAPKTVNSVVNYRTYKGGQVVAQVAGGVRADLMAVVNDQKIMQESPRLNNVQTTAQPTQLPEGRWWWDSAK